MIVQNEITRGGRKRCPHCGSAIKGHPNKKFCGPRCKDKFHNETNPRGYFRHLNDEFERDMDAAHPFNSLADHDPNKD